MRQFNVTLLLAGILVLTACQPHASKRPLADPPQDIASGSTLTLNQTIVIPAGTAALHFQDTKLVSPPDIRRNYAYCKFEPADPSSTERKIEPQSFIVTSVDYDEQAAGSVGDAVSSTRMNLQSGQQTQAYHMTCMLPTAAANARFVTVSEMRGALGSFFTLRRVY